MKLDFVLADERVELAPLRLDNYEALIPIGQQEKLVQYSPSAIATPKSLKAFVETALQLKDNRAAIPFIVFDKAVGKYAGSTRYMNIDWRNKVLEIGSTWIGREFQGTGLNGHMKRLMIDHAFHEMAFEKVGFRVDERNIRSRKAVEKLGAQLEGVLRENVYLLDGFKRNTCCYGLLKAEWKP